MPFDSKDFINPCISSKYSFARCKLYLIFLLFSYIKSVHGMISTFIIFISFLFSEYFLLDGELSFLSLLFDLIFSLTFFL